VGAGDERSTGHRADLMGFAIGVPFGRDRWGMGLGLIPVTRVVYSMEEKVPLGTSGHSVMHNYSGTGGISKAFIGAGFRPLMHMDSLGNGNILSIGANLVYRFGAIDDQRKAYYPRGQGYHNTSFSTLLELRNPGAEVGMQFQGDLRKAVTRNGNGLRYTVGVAVELGSTLGADRTQLVNTFFIGGRGGEIPLDTVRYSEGVKGTIFLPPQYAMAVAVHNAQWFVSVEHRRRDWTGLRVNIEDYDLGTELAPATSYRLGAHYRPGGQGYWNTVTYRAGAHFGGQNVVIGGEQLSELGMAFGLSMPVLGSATFSRLHLGGVAGKRGAGDGSLAERYVGLCFGLTITPSLQEQKQWFKKRRIE
jgi:hypothetical protein